MKTSLLSILAFAVAIGPVIAAQDQDDVKQSKNKSRVAPAAPRHVNAAPRTISQAPKVQRNVNVAPAPRFEHRVNNPNLNRVYTPNVQPRTRTQYNPAVTQSNVNVQNKNWRNKSWDRSNTPVVTPKPPQTTTTAVVQSNVNARNRFDRDDYRTTTTTNNRNWNTNSSRTTTNNNNRNWNNNNTNKNWRNNPSGTWTFEDARRHHRRDHHDRSWWRSRYNRISLFGGGYYYWDNNYWYPAYGYDPYYSTYAYDEPIYGYNNLQPGQVIANVQTALQEQGYYDDAVDGLIGPRTRAALSNFQRDHGLSITAAIDGPTLQALGLY